MARNWVWGKILKCVIVSAYKSGKINFQKYQLIHNLSIQKMDKMIGFNESKRITSKKLHVAGNQTDCQCQ